MCLILFAYQQHAQHELIVAANRDEFYPRPALAAHHWPDAPGITGGRDRTAGGTWLAMNAAGRFAAVTNYSGPIEQPPPPLSRGELAVNFLLGSANSLDYSQAIAGANYAGFSLLTFDGETLTYSSNRGDAPRALKPGYYALANAELDSAWPKVARGKNMLRALVETDSATPGNLLDILADDYTPADDELPARGNDIALERRVSPCFIRGDEYGTRASTAVLVGQGQPLLAERSYGPQGRHLGECWLTR